MASITCRCKGCGREFKTYLREKRKNPPSFCSLECKGSKKSGKSGFSICVTCGNEFNWYRAKGQSEPRVCSNKCRGGLVKEWQSPHGFSWKNIPQEQMKKQLKICFDERVEKTETCWIWTGSKRPDGYGVFHAGGKTNATSAHRLSWKLYHGEIPEGLVLRHMCDNPICVNPDHLKLGTLKDNSTDRILAGNSCPGSKNSKAKLDEEKVKEIKNLIQIGLSGAEIGRRFGVTRTCINAIKNSRTWKHVGDK